MPAGLAQTAAEGSFLTLGDDDLDNRTSWARKVIQDAQGSLKSFADSPD